MNLSQMITILFFFMIGIIFNFISWGIKSIEGTILGITGIIISTITILVLIGKITSKEDPKEESK